MDRHADRIAREIVKEGYPLNPFLDLIKMRAIQLVLDRSETLKEASDFLELEESALYKLIQRRGLKWRTI